MPKDKVDSVMLLVAVSFFVLMLMIAAVMLFRIYLKRKNKLLLEKEMLGIQFEQTLLQSKLEIQEQTFAYISGELHDNVVQVLSLVRLNLNTLHAPDEPDKLSIMDKLMEKGISDLRNLSHTLDADFIRVNGWEKPVIKLLNDLQQTGKYTTQVQLDENLPSPGNEKAIILFRMIQEVINNILKHAAADKIIFEAVNENDKLVITIQDNGKGFSRQLVSDGAGLRNLENRSRMINAELVINSEPGYGTIVKMFIKTKTIE